MDRHTGTSKLNLACIRCSERKVRCNKQNPCGACVRHNAQCTFPEPKLLRRPRKGTSDEQVLYRLKHLETLLQSHGIDPDGGSVDKFHHLHRPRPSVGEEPRPFSQQLAPVQHVSKPEATVFKPLVIFNQRGSRFLDNSLWSRVAGEVHGTQENALEDEASDASASDTVPENDFRYVLGSTPSSARSLHPSTDRIRQLWVIFKENVNPLSKLVHLPTLQPAIERAIINLDEVPKQFEALLFPIYSTAVLSLPESECEEMLGESRSVLLSLYVKETKLSLSRATFMSSTSMVVLQALVLHIISIRDSHEPRGVWTLTGVAMRLAEGMGMRVDGTLLGLSPFETEIRRRIWWQLHMHDFRAAELTGQAKFRHFALNETTPRKPTNVDDRELYPGMTNLPQDSARPTEMIWCMFRSELASFASVLKSRMQKLATGVLTSEEFSASDDLQMKDQFIHELEDLIETKYVRFCDPSQPLQLMTLFGARMSVNLARFLAHHPRRWATVTHVPETERNLVWKTVIQLLEQYHTMQTNPQLRYFAWSVAYFIQWHAVIHVLDTLRAEPHHPDTFKAWQLIDALYQNNMGLILSPNRPIFVAVGNLCLKAFRVRPAMPAQEKSKARHPPDYIVKLREQREMARARNAASNTRRQATGNGRSEPHALTTRDALTSNLSSPRRAALEAEPQNSRPNQPVSYVQAQGQDTYDSGYPLQSTDISDIDFSTVGIGDTMDWDTELMMTQDSWLDKSDETPIDWEQWDTWLGSIDPGRFNNGATASR